MSVKYLSNPNQRGKFMRYDTAIILKRFFLVEQTMVIGQAGWLPSIPYFELKTKMPAMLWEDAMTANALRERIYELRFPNRILEIGDDQILIELIRYSHRAPNILAFLQGISQVLKPAIQKAYENYLELADDIGDGPTVRFLNLAIREKSQHIGYLNQFITNIRKDENAGIIEAADEWVETLKFKLNKIGGIGLEPPNNHITLPEGKFSPAEIPQRGTQFKNVRFYWPDIVDPTFSYGEDFQLQLRSAISHLNEIWAVENAGFILYEFADHLGWEFVYDAARWTYDESRHCRMGHERLKDWGFKDEDLPMGTYIYDSCKGHAPIYRMGMLFYFESKNIRKKIDRIKSFDQMNDKVSQHDMDFDWADETIHTSYGKTWLSKILELAGEDPEDYTDIKLFCEKTVQEMIESVTPLEIQEIKDITEKMTKKAEHFMEMSNEELKKD